ncbi:FAD-dependent oxidoreductase [Martelella endophytica]|uniref:FAD-dependent oxidoreductase n=1 Tax=Martelella endophytica TaxID=1486262 RepID=UPI000697E992|nr:FAD-dependent oxidoreductase [Martelella endophytica]
MSSISRRRLLATGAGIAVAGAFGLPAILARPAHARVLIIGGGPGGVAAALAVKAKSHDADVLVVERDPTRLLRQNETDIITGRRDPADYHKLAAAGVEVSLDDIRSIDWQTRRAEALSGRSFAFDHVILAPGIAMRDEHIAGYDREAAERFPHGWTDRQGVAALAANIRAMANGGTVIIRIPPGRMRFPEGAYRRAGEIARYLEAEKPDAVVVILDHSQPGPREVAMLARLSARFGERIEYVSGELFGAMRSVETENRVLNGERMSLCGDVINFIPAQEAGRIARVSGLADDSGWCPVESETGASRLHQRAYLIGDSSAVAGNADLAAIDRRAQIIANAIA